MGAVSEVYLYSNTGVQLACLPKRLATGMESRSQ